MMSDTKGFRVPGSLARIHFQYLLYFWLVGRCGTIREAAKQLHLTSPTLSAQIRKLERALGQKLFRAEGRRLKLTDAGRLAMEYAEQIFGLGAELAEAMAGQREQGGYVFRVGVVDSVPKLIVHDLLEPILAEEPGVRLMCGEGRSDELLQRLLAHEFDVVIADTPLGREYRSRIFSHSLGESPVSFFAAARLASQLEKEPFPACLGRFPLLLPPPGTELRRLLEQYFDAEGIIPREVHEFADTAMMKVFGESGRGIFPGPTKIQRAICAQYSVTCVGQAHAIKESFYAITTQRQLPHPAVMRLLGKPMTKRKTPS